LEGRGEGRGCGVSFVEQDWRGRKGKEGKETLDECLYEVYVCLYIYWDDKDDA